MKLIGRIIGVLAFFISALGWNRYFYVNHGYISGFQIFLTAVYTITGWWLGKQYDKAKYHSERDVLTGVYNRRLVMEMYPKVFALMDRIGGKSSVLILDIDDFKSVNDTYGHEMGDRVLQTIADTLLNNTRKGDFVARWGGDEFLILSANTDTMGAESIMKRIVRDLQARSAHLNITISVSIGAAAYPDHGETLKDLIKIADHNMYQYKFAKK